MCRGSRGGDFDLELLGARLQGEGLGTIEFIGRFKRGGLGVKQIGFDDVAGLLLLLGFMKNIGGLFRKKRSGERTGDDDARKNPQTG